MSALFFTHIPKTAGTVMRSAVFKPAIAPRARHGWEGIRSAVRSSVEFQLLVGHYSYGVHHLYRVENPRYFVLLRHPIERAISHYHFIKDANSPTYTHPQSSLVEDHTLVSLYEQPGFQNVQTRYIAGLFWQVAGRHFDLNGPVGQYVLHRAKQNLVHRYEAFGLKEEFEASADLFGQCLNQAPEIPSRRIKKKSDRPTAEELSTATYNRLQATNQLDAELYEFARARFDTQMSQMEC
jgi:hypothetical protein